MRFLSFCAMVFAYVFRERESMKNALRKMIPILAVMCLTVFFALHFSWTERKTVGGSCGNGVQYTVSGSKADGFTLTISGSGTVTKSPWNSKDALTGDNLYRTTIKKIVIAEGVTGLCEGCFAELTGVSSVTIPSTLSSIPKKAFMNCLGLKKIDLKKVTRIGDFAFSNCSTLASVTCNSVTKIGACAFQYCNFTSFTLPASVTDFDNTAFDGNREFASYKCTDGQKTYRSVNSVLYSKDGKTLVAVPYTWSGEFTIPGFVRTVKSRAFASNKGITRLVIPADVHTIETYAFTGMSALRKAEIACHTSIPARAFSGCTALSSVTFAEGVREIESKAFAGCNSLSVSAFPKSMLRVATDAFATDISGAVGGFTKIGKAYVKTHTVSVQAVENQDIAAGLLGIINETFRGGKTALTWDSSLTNLALARATEVTVYYDSLNPTRPDGSQQTTGAECVLIGTTYDTPQKAAAGLNADAMNKSRLTGSEYKNIGIACVNKGGVTYLVCVLGTGSGDGVAPAGGSRERSAEITVADYLSVKPEAEKPVPGGTDLTKDGNKNTYVPPVHVSGNGGNGGNTDEEALVAYSCQFGNAFGLVFYVSDAVAAKHDSSYLKLEIPVYEGDKVSGTKTEKISVYATENYNGKKCRVYSYYGLAAKEMTTKVGASFVGLKDGKETVYESGDYSVEDYVLTMLTGGKADAKLRTLLVDMLCYGAEAQRFFGYHTGRLADAGIAAYLKYGTQKEANLTASSYANESTGAEAFSVYSFGLSLENRPSISFFIRTDRKPAGEEAYVSYIKDGKSVYKSIPADGWTNLGNGTYRVDVTGVSVAECRNAYTLYIVGNGTTLSNRLTVSMEGYCKLVKEQNPKAYALADRLLRFGDAAKMYINR